MSQGAAGAKTPTWDLAVACEVAGARGVVLVEAKANVSELKEEGKRLPDDASQHSQENHEQIARAIAESRTGLSQIVPGVKIDRDSHYQQREAFLAHPGKVAPVELFDRRVDIQGTPLWVLIRSRAVLIYNAPRYLSAGVWRLHNTP